MVGGDGRSLTVVRVGGGSWELVGGDWWEVVGSCWVLGGSG